MGRGPHDEAAEQVEPGDGLRPLGSPPACRRSERRDRCEQPALDRTQTSLARCPGSRHRSIRSEFRCDLRRGAAGLVRIDGECRGSARGRPRPLQRDWGLAYGPRPSSGRGSSAMREDPVVPLTDDDPGLSEGRDRRFRERVAASPDPGSQVANGMPASPARLRRYRIPAAAATRPTWGVTVSGPAPPPCLRRPLRSAGWRPSARRWHP